MLKNLKNQVNGLAHLLTNEKTRVRVMFLCIYVVFAVVSLVMTIINIFTPFKALMWSTTIFSVLMIVDFLISIKKGKVEIVARYLFSAEVIILCTFFIIHGEPEGFSAIWCSILPLGGLLLYRKSKGTIISAIMFFIVIACFWIPWEDFGIHLLQYNYTSSFKLRFPVFYLSCYCVGFLFESIREYTQKELEKSRNKFYELSYTDLLTGVNNRNSYEQQIKFYTNIKYLSLFVAFFDANGLHKLNDEKGHDAGDKMLITIAGIIRDEFGKENTYRIGGDEFVVIIPYPGQSDYRKRIEKVAALISEQGYSTAKGMYLSHLEKSSISEIINAAEKDMYLDKSSFYKTSGLDRRIN